MNRNNNKLKETRNQRNNINTANSEKKLVSKENQLYCQKRSNTLQDIHY